VAVFPTTAQSCASPPQVFAQIWPEGTELDGTEKNMTVTGVDENPLMSLKFWT